jgi:outer membrane protein assembly factor BamB
MKTLRKLYVATGILLFLNSVTGISQDWPQWRGVNRDDKVTGFIVPAQWPGELRQEWKVSVGPGDATPALVNNRLYVFTRNGETEILQCLDAGTGKLIWKSEGYHAITATGPAAAHPGPRSSPAVSEGKIITIGIGGDIACYDAENGKLVWRNEDYKGAVPKFYTGMSPLVYSGVCVVILGGPDTGKFIAFDITTGKIKWETEGDGPAYGSPAMLNVDGNRQVVFQTQTKLTALDFSNGKILWEIPTPVGEGRVNNAASPMADGQKLFFTGMNNGVNAVEIKKTGNNFTVNKLWTNPDFSTAYNTPVLKDGFLYGISNKGRLFCIDIKNGKTAWSDDTPLQNFGSTIDVGSVMIALSSNDIFIVFKPDGKAFVRLASYKVSDNAIYAHPVLSGKRIFIKDSDSVICFTAD